MISPRQIIFGGTVAALTCLGAAPSSAATYAYGDCLTQNGTRIKYVIRQGRGVISYNGGKSHPMFTKRDGEFGIITHVGDIGTMILAVNFLTGRGYMITKYDSGSRVEQNITCDLGSIDK